MPPQPRIFQYPIGSNRVWTKIRLECTCCNKLILSKWTHTFLYTYWSSGLRPSFSFHLCCVLIQYMSGAKYNLKSTPNVRFLRNFFLAILFILRVLSGNLQRSSCRSNIFSYFILFEMSDLGFKSWPHA